MKKTAGLYQVDGQTVTIAQIGERLGLSHGAAYARLHTALKRGRPISWQALGEGAPASRAMQIMRYVVALGRSATLEEIVDAIAQQEPHSDRRKLAMTISAQLSQLSKRHRKLRRTGKPRAYSYLPTSEALVDRRKSAPQPKRAPRPTPTKPATPTTPRRVTPAPSPTAAIAPQSRRPGEFRVTSKPAPFVVPNANLTRPRDGGLDSAQIAADIAAFEARGGRIQRFKPGESSQSIREQNDAFIAARGHGIAKQRAAARIASRTRASNDETLDADDQVDVA